MDIAAKIPQFIIFFVPFLFSLCFHEFAHGWMALRKGDDTARLMGRLTMNPLAHMDPIGTLLLPALAILLGWPFFGWAKPVPVNEGNLKKPLKDMFWIAAAGPLSNIGLAVLGAFGLVVTFYYFKSFSHSSAVIEFFKAFLMINLFLAFFNLIPLHPLDGGKILARFLPHELNHKLESNQHFSGMILLVLFFTGIIGFIAYPVMWTQHTLIRIIESLVL